MESESRKRPRGEELKSIEVSESSRSTDNGMTRQVLRGNVSPITMFGSKSAPTTLQGNAQFPPQKPARLSSSFTGGLTPPSPLMINGHSNFPSQPSRQPHHVPFSEKIRAPLLEALLMDGAAKNEENENVAKELAECIAGSGKGSDHLRRLMPHLKDPKNKELRERILSGEIKPEEFIKMPEAELANPEIRKKREEQSATRAADRNWVELKKSMSLTTSMFRCPKCGARTAKMEQRQMRSADEPMTIILTCEDCGKVWKKN